VLLISFPEVLVICNVGGRAHQVIFDAAALDTLTTVADSSPPITPVSFPPHTKPVILTQPDCGITLTTDEKIKEKFAERWGTLHDVHVRCFPA